MRSSLDKLRAICSDTIGIEPDRWTAFLFTNKSRDCLLVYSMDDSGDQTVMKKLDKGAFLLPAPDSQQPFVTMKPSALSRLFRT